MKQVILALALLAVLALPATGQAATAEETLKSTLDEMLSVLKQPADKGTPQYQKERKQLETIISGIFAFDELSARAVGLHWKRFSPEQKEQFIKAFSDLLGAKYLDRIQSYNNERIILGDKRTSSRGNVEIQSVIVQSDKEIPIAYRMTETDEGWKVYDVVVEGVSLVKNYRSQFMELMVNGKPEDLIKAVRDKANASKSRGSSLIFPDMLQGGKVICSLFYAMH